MVILGTNVHPSHRQGPVGTGILGFYAFISPTGNFADKIDGATKATNNTLHSPLLPPAWINNSHSGNSKFHFFSTAFLTPHSFSL
jgi:hypothetical protein